MSKSSQIVILLFDLITNQEPKINKYHVFKLEIFEINKDKNKSI